MPQSSDTIRIGQWLVMVAAGKSSHAHCRLRCNFGHSEQQMSVWSTPKSANSHAKQIIYKVNECKGLDL